MVYVVTLQATQHLSNRIQKEFEAGEEHGDIGYRIKDSNNSSHCSMSRSVIGSQLEWYRELVRSMSSLANVDAATRPKRIQNACSEYLLLCL